MGLDIGDVITGGIGIATGNPALIGAGVAGAFGPSASDIARQQAAGSGFQPVPIQTSMGSTSYATPEQIASYQRILESGATDPARAEEIRNLIASGDLDMAGGGESPTIARLREELASLELTPERRAELQSLIDRGPGVSGQLSPELQALQSQLFGMAPEALSQFQTFDPAEAGKLFTQRLDELAAPKEEKQRLALENRLFKQGLLSSSSGADQTQSILEAQALAQGQRDITGLQFGQQQQNRLFQQFLDTLGAGTSIGDIERQMLGMTLGAAPTATSAAQTQANILAQGRQDDAAVQQQFFNNLIAELPTTFGGGADASGLFTQPVAGQTQAQMIAAQNQGLF